MTSTWITIVIFPVLLCAVVLAEARSITVLDYNNQKITLHKPATRIVVLAPHIAENVYSAGAGAHLVGAVDYCDYPPQVKNVTRVGSISSHSLEAIVSLNPDLVIAWDSGNGGRVVPKLRALGIPVYASNPKKLEDVARSIQDYGALAGTHAIAGKAAQHYLKRLQRLQKNNHKKKPLSVLYQVWNNPLQTLNDKHIISDLIRLCGGVNAFGDSPVIAPKISVEAVLTRNPDVIVASGMGEQRPDWLQDWLRWPSLNAVKHNTLYFIPPDIIQRHTARILDGAAEMCGHLDNARNKITPPIN